MPKKRNITPMEGTDTESNELPVRKRRFSFKKKHIKWYVLGAIAIAIGIVVLQTRNAIEALGSMAPATDFTTLSYSNVRDAINATGIVASTEKTNVYSSSSYTVQEILVDVGDRVQAGDVLLELDRESIENMIHERELTMETSEKSGSQSVKNARDSYNAYKEGLAEGTNSSLISANSSVQNAYDNYQKAIRTYEDYQDSLRTGANTTAQANSYDTAKRAYDTARSEYDIANGELAQAAADYENAKTNSVIIDAENAVTAAEAVYNNAMTELASEKITYDAALAAFASGGPLTAYQAAELVYLAAQTAVDVAKADWDQKKQLLEHELSTANASNVLNKYNSAVAKVDAKSAALRSAKSAFETAEAAYDAALESSNNNLREYQIAIDTAYTAYETALRSRTSAEVAADNQLQSYKNAVDAASIGADTSLAEYQLAQMYVDLEEATITAPVSGTVTAVFATKGAASTGILFIIEDTESLIVESTVKEYDIGTITEGLTVSIKSDATGDEEYAGKLRFIAPAARKNTLGDTDTTGEILFESEIDVVDTGTPLRIGMSVRLDYIIEEAVEVLSVPYDAIYQNAAGQDCVLAAQDQGDGTFLLKEMPVTTGLENDLNIVISGDGIVPGLSIINTPGNYMDGQQVAMAPASLLGGDGFNGMQMGFRMGG